MSAALNMPRRGFLRSLCATAGAVPVVSVAALSCDPIFAALQRHRELVAVIDTIPIDDDGPVYEAACDAEEAALQVLARTAPTTPAGAAALLLHMLERERAHMGEESTGSPFETSANTIARALRTMGGQHV